MAEHREFEMVCEGTTNIDLHEHSDFLMLLQEAVFYSLEKHDLLTESQRKECVVLLEKQRKRMLKGCDSIL